MNGRGPWNRSPRVLSTLCKAGEFRRRPHWGFSRDPITITSTSTSTIIDDINCCYFYYYYHRGQVLVTRTGCFWGQRHRAAPRGCVRPSWLPGVWRGFRCWGGGSSRHHQSYTSKGIQRQGIGSFCKEFLCFDTMSCRHMPLLAHF